MPPFFVQGELSGPTTFDLRTIYRLKTATESRTPTRLAADDFKYARHALERAIMTEQSQNTWYPGKILAE